jgi:hypothetical protein
MRPLHLRDRMRGETRRGSRRISVVFFRAFFEVSLVGTPPFRTPDAWHLSCTIVRRYCCCRITHLPGKDPGAGQARRHPRLTIVGSPLSSRYPAARSFLSLTPGPSPSGSINAIPPASRARRIASVAAVRRCSPLLSNWPTSATPSRAAAASFRCDQPRRERAARH